MISPNHVDHDQLLIECFGSADFPPGDVVLQVRRGDHVLSHLDVYWRTVGVGREEVRVAAIGQVCTDPAFRGLGLVSALVRSAHVVAEENGLDWAALFGDLALYERFGYRSSAEPPRPDFLLCPLTPGAEWPAGAIDTRGVW